MLFDIDATIVSSEVNGFRNVSEFEAYRELIKTTNESPHLLPYVDIGMMNIDVIEICSKREIDPELAISLIGDDNQLRCDEL